LSEEIIKDKDLENIGTAIQIVEEYFDDYKKEDESFITDEEKKYIIETILNNSLLNKERTNYLMTLIENIKKTGIKEEKDVYGFIIKLAIEGNGIAGYSDFINGKGTKKLIDFIKQNQENQKKIKEKCTVIDETIEKCLMNNGILSERIEKKVKELGISEEIIKEKDLRNTYTALQIVEEYFGDYKKEDGSIVTNEEKKYIIEAILNNSLLNEEYSGYLSTLIENIKKAGIEKDKDVYGFIIKLALEGNGIAGYSEFIEGKGIKNLINFIKQNQEDSEKIKEKCTVTDKVIETCLIDKGILSERIKKKVEELGISEEIIKEKDLRNIDIAIQIVEEYFKEYRKENRSIVTNEEKRYIIEVILNNNKLNKKRGVYYLSTLIENIKKAGIEKDKDIYGFIIKSAIEGNGISAYTKFINGSAIKNLIDFIEQNQENTEIIKEKCTVTDKTIQKAVKKVNKKKKVQGKDIMQATMELTIEGNGGSKICDDVAEDYKKLLERKKEQGRKEE